MVRIRRVMPLVIFAALSVSCGRESTCPVGPGSGELGILWQKPTEWVWLGTPAVANASFYLSIRFGTLSEMSILDGGVTREVNPQEPNDYEQPLIDGGTIFLSCGNSNVCALDLAELRSLWSTYVFPPDSDCCGMHIEYELSRPIVDASSVYFTSEDGDLYCLERSSGALRWKQRIGRGSVAAPALLSGVVYAVGFDSLFSAVSAETGALLWQISIGQDVEWTGLKAMGSLIYGAGDGGFVFCVDPGARGVRWRSKVGKRFRAEISVSRGLICAADESGIYALDPGTGNCKWSRPTRAEGPIEVDGRIYCFSDDRYLLVLDARTGRVLGQREIGEPGFFNQPVVIGDRVLAAGRGVIYCLQDVTD